MTSYTITGKEPKDVTDWKAIGRPEEIIIPEGHTEPVRIVGIDASQANPVIVGGGSVTVAATLSYALKFDACKHFHLQRTHVIGGNLGVTADKLSSDFEISFLEISKTGFAAVMAKDDSQKVGGPFVMRNVKLHHLVISDTGGEGLYIGSTSLDGHDLENVEISHCLIRRSGWDGLQLGHCTAGASVHDNRIEDTGLAKKQFQGNGIQLGDRTGALCFNNVIKRTYGNGIICLGSGTHVYGNKIHHAGENGIYCDDRPDTKEGFMFINNEIVSPAVYCLSLHANKGLQNEALNNMFVLPGGYAAAVGTNRNPFLERDKDVVVKELNNLSSMDAGLAAYLLNRN